MGSEMCIRDRSLRLDRIQTVESFASRRSVFTGQHSESITNVLSVFRDLCVVVWTMDSRDALSLALRQKALGLKQQVHQFIFSSFDLYLTYTIIIIIVVIIIIIIRAEYIQQIGHWLKLAYGYDWELA